MLSSSYSGHRHIEKPAKHLRWSAYAYAEILSQACLVTRRRRTLEFYIIPYSKSKI